MLRDDIFSLRSAFLESRVERTEERDPMENEKANTPIHMRTIHITLSLELFPEISPNPTVVTVVRTK